jgi:hypothetical protein
MKNEEQTPKEPQTEALHIADVSCCAVWKKISSQYSESNGLFIGKILVASYHWNGMRPKGDPLIYRVTSPIKGIRNDWGDFATEAECKARCLEVVNTFVKMLQHGS